MVYKEEVFSWFKELTGSRRIEVMCGLLNMCFPLELRFFGTCLEDLAGKDFPMLRETEQKANNVADLSKLINIKDTVNRSKLIVSLALLNASNRACSDVIFKTLHEEVNVESWSCLSVDEKSASEILLLLTMALHHPAFTHEQRSILAQHLLAVEKLFEGENSKVLVPEPQIWRGEKAPVCAACGQILPTAVSTLPPAPPVSCPQATVIPVVPVTTSVQLSVATSTVIACTTTCSHHVVCTQCNDMSCRGGANSEHILDLEVKEMHRKKSCRIRVNWSNGKSTEILKTHQEIWEFCKKVLQLMGGHEKDIPVFTGMTVGNTHLEEITEDLLPQVAEYMRHLVLNLPPHLAECDLIISFFHHASPRAANSQNSKAASVTFPENGSSEGTRVRSLTIYNSQMSESPSTGKAAPNSNKPRGVAHNACPTVRSASIHTSPGANSNTCNNVIHNSSPVTSPLSSPMSSPYVSPSASVTSSRSASPWTQRPLSVTDHGAQNGPTNESLEGLNFEQLLKIERLNKYADKLHDYKPEELKAMSDDQLRRLGLTLGAVGKLRKLLENYRSLPNGITSHSVPNTAVSVCPSTHSVNNAQLIQRSFPEVSSESSPSGSEYSSPPPSPSPLDPACLQLQSSNSSSSEESLNDKGNVSQKSDGKSSSSIGSNSGRETNNHLVNMRRRNSQNPAINNNGRKVHNRSQENGPANKYITDTLRQNALNLTMAAVAQPVSVVPNHPHPHSHHQTHKLAHVPLHPRTSLSPAHIGAGTIVFENSQFGRFNPALLPHNNVPRSHSGTPERTLPVSASMSTIFPYAVITSGGTAVLTPTRSVTTYRNSGVVNATTVVSSGNNAKMIQGSMHPRECDSAQKSQQQPTQQQMSDLVPALYTADSHYLIQPGSPGVTVPSTNMSQAVPTSMPATSTCSASISSGHHPPNSLTSAPSPAPPSQPTPVSVSYNCLSFLPQLFPQTFPFLPSPTNTPANGFISQSIPAHPHAPSFPFPIPNGISTAVTPEIIYANQGFHLPSPSPSPTPTPGPVQQAPPTTPTGPPPPPPNARYLAYVGACGFPPPQGLSHPNTVPIKPFSCYNCGGLGHRGSDCKDSNFDELTKAGQYRLNYVRTSKPMETPE